MDIQLAIFLKFNSLKREREQEGLSLKEGSSLQLLNKERSFTAHLKQSREINTGLHIHPLKSIQNWRVN